MVTIYEQGSKALVSLRLTTWASDGDKFPFHAAEKPEMLPDDHAALQAGVQHLAPFAQKYCDGAYDTKEKIRKVVTDNVNFLKKDKKNQQKKRGARWRGRDQR